MLASDGLYSCRRNTMHSAVFRNNFSELQGKKLILLSERIIGRLKAHFAGPYI